MTLNELIEKLEDIRKFCPSQGESEVMAWDPDCEEWRPMTGMTYNTDGDVVDIQYNTDGEVIMVCTDDE